MRRKQIKSFGVRVDVSGALIVPVYDASGTLQSLQFIDADGKKQFLTGGKIGGGRFLIGDAPKPAGTICVCEGFATGATIHEATGYSVFVAFNCGNLEAVAISIRALYPQAKVTICADNDHQTPENPGLNAAKRAAAACNGSIAIPLSLTGVTDFNDLACLSQRAARHA